MGLNVSNILNIMSLLNMVQLKLGTEHLTYCRRGTEYGIIFKLSQGK